MSLALLRPDTLSRNSCIWRVAAFLGQLRVRLRPLLDSKSNAGKCGSAEYRISDFHTISFHPPSPASESKTATTTTAKEHCDAIKAPLEEGAKHLSREAHKRMYSNWLSLRSEIVVKEKKKVHAYR